MSIQLKSRLCQILLWKNVPNEQDNEMRCSKFFLLRIKYFCHILLAIQPGYVCALYGNNHNYKPIIRMEGSVCARILCCVKFKLNC